MKMNVGKKIALVNLALQHPYCVMFTSLGPSFLIHTIAIILLNTSIELIGARYIVNGRYRLTL